MKHTLVRLWDLENKKMLYPDGQYGDDLEENSTTIALWTIGQMNNVSDEFQEQYVGMECVGRTDIKNQPVYEGDIVVRKEYIYPDQIGKEKEILSETGEVVWSHYFLRFAFVTKDMEDQAEYKSLNAGNVKIEKLGNIFENSELGEKYGIKRFS